MLKYFIAGIIVIGISIGGYYAIRSSGAPVVPIPTVDNLVSTTSDQTTATTTSPKMVVYTMNQVAFHGSASDCWTVVNGNVYNLTSFIPNHPGGNAIIKACGKDGTRLFNSEDEHVEQNAQATLDAFKIGVLTN